MQKKAKHTEKGKTQVRAPLKYGMRLLSRESDRVLSIQLLGEHLQGSNHGGN